ncbi:MAG TPA: hypothetical protein VFE47_29715 [Tepidisphaeraceae bacterium]|jgi:hypothetical protein|nr:hypothetical protein [Tepidisphaeraceae bacterium]
MFHDRTWAVFDDAMRYDAANDGRIEQLYFMRGNTRIALDQFRNEFYDPGLLAKYLGQNRQPLKAVPK